MVMTVHRVFESINEITENLLDLRLMLGFKNPNIDFETSYSYQVIF